MALDILGRVKTYLNLTKTDKDSFLNSLIIDVSNYIESYCNQAIELVGTTMRQISLDENNYIIIPYTVPTTIVSIEYKHYLDSTADYVTIDSQYYNVVYDEQVKKIILDSNYIDSHYIYKISMYVGYAEGYIPYEILSIATEMVVWRYKESMHGDNTLAKRSISTSQSNSTATTTYYELQSRWHEALMKYKIIPSF